MRPFAIIIVALALTGATAQAQIREQVLERELRVQPGKAAVAFNRDYKIGGMAKVRGQMNDCWSSLAKTPVSRYGTDGIPQKMQWLATLPQSLFADVTPFFIFCSPSNATLDVEGRPPWVEESSRLLYMPLESPPLVGPLLRVERCRADGKRDASGGHWHVVSDARGARLGVEAD